MPKKEYRGEVFSLRLNPEEAKLVRLAIECEGKRMDARSVVAKSSAAVTGPSGASPYLRIREEDVSLLSSNFF